MIVRVTEVSIRKPYKVHLRFNDGVEKTVDLKAGTIPRNRYWLGTRCCDSVDFEEVL